jgi:hypothetical protein
MYQLTAVVACYPRTDLVLRYEVKARPRPAQTISRAGVLGPGSLVPEPGM